MLFFKLFRKKAISRVSLEPTKTRGPFVFMVRCSSCKENYFKRERRREGFSNGKLSYDQPDDQLTEIRSSPPVVMYMKVYFDKVFNWEFRNHQQDWPPTGEGGFFPGVTNTLPQKFLGQPGLLDIPPPTLSFCGQQGCDKKNPIDMISVFFWCNSSNSFSQSLVNITCASHVIQQTRQFIGRMNRCFKLSKIRCQKNSEPCNSWVYSSSSLAFCHILPISLVRFWPRPRRVRGESLVWGRDWVNYVGFIKATDFLPPKKVRFLF